MAEIKSTYFIETYGCQMNKYDSELVAGILEGGGYAAADSLESSDIILINTCSVRESAETRVRGRLNALKSLKAQDGRVVGVLGCMAERLHAELIDSFPLIDFILGPDSYRALPEVLANLGNGGSWSDATAACSSEETYAGIVPKRIPGKSWIAIMRGCNNYCSYCIVPYVRGRERSRSSDDILEEARSLVMNGFLEITLLGQNVNSYRCGEVDFAGLLEKIARIEGLRRVRFATSHPKDLSQKLIETIAAYHNICHHVHLPVQSGSDRILALMNRGYTYAAYTEIVRKIRDALPGVALTTDIIVGFPGETQEDFERTRQLVEEVKFDAAFIFKYSPRAGTAAARLVEHLSDSEKIARLEELLRLQKGITLSKNRMLCGVIEEVLVEGVSKKSDSHFIGRTPGNKIVVMKKSDVIKGDIVRVMITGAEGHTLFGEVVQ